MHDEDAIRLKYESLSPVMDERTRRLWAAAEARSLGRGGASAVFRATGLSRVTIASGIRELENGVDTLLLPDGGQRKRRSGGGRKLKTQENPALAGALEALIEPTTRGDPESPLRWTCKSLRVLAEELTSQGHPISHQTVSDLLHGMGYSLQANQKTREGEDHPDRNAQFEHIKRRTESHLNAGEPVISVDTKKKELIGNYKNAGREWHPKGEPEEVKTHDFIDPELGKVTPYGVYDLANNEGWVNVGTDHDTPAFAVESIARWWKLMGRGAFPDATKLLIMADAGGSNGYRSRLWKTELQALADRTCLLIEVAHFPPGTSKWNKIEHRMFSHITQNWRGRPLVSQETVVELIAATKTTKGLRIKAALDRRSFPKGIKVSDAEMQAIQMKCNKFHGEWNYTLKPRQSKDES